MSPADLCILIHATCLLGVEETVHSLAFCGRAGAELSETAKKGSVKRAISSSEHLM